MAEITSPVVIDFVTQYARPLATEIEALYFKCKIASREWLVLGVSSACAKHGITLHVERYATP